MIAIDKNVPVPEGSCRKCPKYPIANMQIGDSFFVEGKTSQEIWGSLQRFKEKKGFRFTVRKEGAGVRVWRIDPEINGAQQALEETDRLVKAKREFELRHAECSPSACLELNGRGPCRSEAEHNAYPKGRW